MSLLVKICGLRTPETVIAARDAGADLIGFVFFPRSPRAISVAEAVPLAASAREGGHTRIVALVVDADPALINEIATTLKPDFFQCHGSETPGELVRIAEATGIPAFRAVGVATSADVEQVASFAAVPGFVLIDAKAPKDAAYPGGHGRPFDWSILHALDPTTPFMLSGGLSPETVGDAVGVTGALGLMLIGVDVSSGVERAPGIKDPERIRAFVAAARDAESLHRKAQVSYGKMAE